MVEAARKNGSKANLEMKKKKKKIQQGPPAKDDDELRDVSAKRQTTFPASLHFEMGTMGGLKSY